MKHQYFGDVNDFLKYGLLRCIVRSGFRLGVCWMLTPADGRPDGRKTQYLRSAETWRAHDPALFDSLKKTVVESGDRHLRHIEAAWILETACFFGIETPDSRPLREEWFRRMRFALESTDLVFMDPDNGLEVPSKPIGQTGSSKYVYWAELTELWNARKSLLIYQHYPRKNRHAYVAQRVDECMSKLPGARVYALSSANVLFLLVAQPMHVVVVSNALKEIDMRWGSRISVVLTRQAAVW